MKRLLLVALAASACLKRAPTTYELDRRAGFPVGDDGFSEPLRTSSSIPPQTRMPARVEPVVRKVWVVDRLLDDGAWLQGTWLYVEVEPARWLEEVDPGSAPFATQESPR